MRSFHMTCRRKSPPTNRDLILDPATSARLGRVRQHGTSAELRVRKLLHALGHRFRAHNKDLPGSPDIANRARRWVIFVHGCFWHRHQGCSRTTTPRRNQDFWQSKFDANVARDARVQAVLRATGWRVFVVWECEVEAPRGLAPLRRWLSRIQEPHARHATKV